MTEIDTLIEFWSTAYRNPSDMQFQGSEWDQVRANADWTLAKLKRIKSQLEAP